MTFFFVLTWILMATGIIMLVVSNNRLTERVKDWAQCAQLRGSQLSQKDVVIGEFKAALVRMEVEAKETLLSKDSRYANLRKGVLDIAKEMERVASEG